ncbi:MarR family winged helix-turn-helix transcriptional regulator [Actinoplanes sp. NPDC026670]|uniref:MarR family winged helix-turn-helix transcriptional regulator n=1 Tax=Actinoplanes sp. NPDC026670 TaxID=3154700 RepID=UPI0034019D68
MTDDLPGLVALCRRAEAACEQHRRNHLRRAGYPDLHSGLMPILAALAQRDHTIGELAAALGITVHDAAQRVGLLEARAYAHRQGAPGDIRQRIVVITEAGQAATDLDRSLQDELQQQVIQQIGEPGVTAARQVLAALTAYAGSEPLTAGGLTPGRRGHPG